jgi:hypothetical protein
MIKEVNPDVVIVDIIDDIVFEVELFKQIEIKGFLHKLGVMQIL